MTSLYLITAAGFLILAFIFAFILITVLQRGIDQTKWKDDKKRKVKSRLLWGMIIWFAFLGVFSLTGVAGNFNLFPLNAAPVLVLPLVTILILISTKNSEDILQQITQPQLIRLQVFRIIVELLLWALFYQEILPIQMTFEGRNWDILAGITAPIIAHTFSGNKNVVLIWNIICLGLLINIVTIAILSMPTPLRAYMNDPANTIVMKFPFIVLPGFLVPLAYTLHFLSLKKLILTYKTTK